MIESSDRVVIVPVILCGGSGTRLWPLSRQSYPKQFLRLTGEYSLFQQTILRLDGFCQNNHDALRVENPIIVTNEVHRFLVLDQLHQLDRAAQIILEPVGKNTAPSLSLASLCIKESYPNDEVIMLVLPADHAIDCETIYCQTLLVAANAIACDEIAIATLGLKPTYPETGYGYIECQPNEQAVDYSSVVRFIEKPDLHLAEEYIKQQEFYWNSGIFILKSHLWLEMIEKFDTDIYTGVCAAWDSKKRDNPFIRPHAEQFTALPSNSIDYAVIEPCTNHGYKLGMFELATRWSDLGTWQAVSDYQHLNNANSENNVFLGDVVSIDTTSCYVYAEKRLVSLLGVADLIVVDTDDAILVAHKSHSQDVKEIVSQLNKHKRAEANIHQKVYRPWGWYHSIDESERFKVKRICVKPKASLSLQKHHHRAEHWVVVKGTAQVVCDDKTMLLTENQSTYIPLGAVHRLSNPGSIPLEMIEVQSGSYLEEDDVIRIEDDYGRK